MRILPAILVLLLSLCPAVARADYQVTFYAHDQDRDFPHAFFTVKGHPDKGGTEVDTNIGFTAVSVTFGLLWGSVKGEIQHASPGYIGRSIPMFGLRVDDKGYAALMAVVDRWDRARQPTYNLNHHNCIHFEGEALQSLGIKVEYPPGLMKKPHLFLLNVMRLNPQLGPPPK